MPYVPNATDTTQPTADKTVESAAQEFRALKAKAAAMDSDLAPLAAQVASLSATVVNSVALPPTPRAGKVLAFDAGGEPTTIFLSPSLDGGLRADLASAEVIKGAALVAYGDRSVAEKLSDIVALADHGGIPDGSDQTAEVTAAVAALDDNSVLHIPSGTRHTLLLGDIPHLGVNNRYLTNINATTFSNSITANALASCINFDRKVYLFGDSHGWGQGAPEWDYFPSSPDWAAHSSYLFNLGFMARVERYVVSKIAIDEKVHCLVGVPAGFRWSPSQVVSHASPLYAPIQVVSGRVISQGAIEYDPAASGSDKAWYAPEFAADAAKVNIYRDKLFKGKFPKWVFSLMPPETASTFNAEGKTEFFELLPVPNVAVTGGYTAVLDDNGNVLAEQNGTIFRIRISKSVPLSDFGVNLLTTPTEFFVPGFGPVIFQAATDSGTHLTVPVVTTSFTFPTNLAKYISANMRIYFGATQLTSCVRAVSSAPFRKAYIAVRRHSGGRKIRVFLQSNALFPHAWNPYGRQAIADGYATISQSNRPVWNWGATGKPAVSVITPSGVRLDAGAFNATIAANYIEIDTYGSSNFDAVYEIDYGSRVSSPLFIADAGVSASGTNTDSQLRGVIFNNNNVVNFSMGAHTVGDWIGNFGTTDDHLQDIIDFSTDTPALVVTQLPLVNQYLQQTPIATFKLHIASFITRLNATKNAGGIKVTDFLFFTSLGTKEVEFSGAASSAITYDMYAAAAKEQVIASGAGFLDTRQMIKDMVSRGQVDYNRLFSDSNHPGAFANELIADKLKRVLDEIF